eukprot:jgi/Hompol1/7090/HPOL_005188-RA
METTWVAKLIAVQLGSNATETVTANLVSSKAIQRFLGDANVSLLAVTIDNQTGAVKCSQDIDDGTSGTSATVILSKTRPSVITPDNMVDIIQATPVKSTPINTLYQAVHTVYAPVLLKNSRAGLNSRLQGLLSDLDIGLAGSILASGESKTPDAGHVAIVSVQDEYSYWSDLASNDTNSKIDRERASFFRDILSPLKNDFAKQGPEPLKTLLETVDGSSDVLDEL